MLLLNSRKSLIKISKSIESLKVNSSSYHSLNKNLRLRLLYDVKTKPLFDQNKTNHAGHSFTEFSVGNMIKSPRLGFASPSRAALLQVQNVNINGQPFAGKIENINNRIYIDAENFIKVLGGYVLSTQCKFLFKIGDQIGDAEIVNSTSGNKLIWVKAVDKIAGINVAWDEAAKLVNVTFAKGRGTSNYWRQQIIGEARYWCQNSTHILYHSDAEHSRLHVLDRNNPPKVLDCSEFTSSIYYTVFNKMLNIGTCCGFNKSYPSDTQELRGSRVSSIYGLKPGDLMFFDWSDSPCEDGIDHVGIYVGNNQFAQAHGTNSNPKYTEITTINDYYIKHFVEGSQIIQDNNNTYINKPGNGEIKLPCSIG